MNIKVALLDRREVMAMLPGMNLRRFKRTSLYAMLKIHEVRMTRQMVLYPRAKVNQSLKIVGIT